MRTHTFLLPDAPTCPQCVVSISGRLVTWTWRWSRCSSVFRAILSYALSHTPNLQAQKKGGRHTSEDSGESHRYTHTDTHTHARARASALTQSHIRARACTHSRASTERERGRETRTQTRTREHTERERERESNIKATRTLATVPYFRFENLIKIREGVALWACWVMSLWDRSCQFNMLFHPVTAHWRWANQSQYWPNNANHLAGFSSLSSRDGIVALGKAHARSAPPLSSLPTAAQETVPMFV